MVDPPLNLEQIESSINSAESKFKNTLCESISTLLESAILRSKSDKTCPKISSFHHQESFTLDGKKKKKFEVSYSIRRGKIYLHAFDPESDTVDSGDSHRKEISTEEFLEWVKQDIIHAVDVYRCLSLEARAKKPEYYPLPVDSYL